MADSRPCACVILAAGEGKRMRSDLPKVAHRLAGKALINHVLDSAGGLSPVEIVVVVPPHDRLIKQLVPPPVRTVVQSELLGTGHALLQARRFLGSFQGNLLVLCGDVPLITPSTLQRLLAFHQQRQPAATILVGRLQDPTGYGRIVRKNKGEIVRIVEEADTDIYQKVLEEVNTGTYCFRCPEIWPLLEKIGNQNRQGEYYLTDAIHLMIKNGMVPETVMVEDAREIWGINSRRQLAVAERIFQERTIQNLQDNGITVVRPEATYVEAGVEIGRDTIIHPFSVIETGVRIGRGCRLGPFVHLRAGEVVPDRSEIKGSPGFLRKPEDSLGEKAEESDDERT